MRSVVDTFNTKPLWRLLQVRGEHNPRVHEWRAVSERRENTPRPHGHANAARRVARTPMTRRNEKVRSARDRTGRAAAAHVAGMVRGKIITGKIHSVKCKDLL